MSLSKPWFTLSRPTRLATSTALGALALAGAWLGFHALAGPSFTPNLQPKGWVARPTLSSFNVASGQETIYRPGYVASKWFGRLTAFEITPQGDQGGTARWTKDDAADLLDDKVAGTGYDTGRVIFSRNGGVGVPFRWDNLTDQRGTLGSSNTLQQNTLNFIRGDRSNEGTATTSLRVRQKVLGDIIHSPLTHWNHGNGIRRLYVGANDGMMHVFDAATGQEVYAYIPSTVIPNLKTLASPTYSQQHYVDGPFAIADVRVGTGVKTYLVGGLGAGGRGLYSLDVTTTTSTATITESDAASKVKWEINHSTNGYSNLGFTYSAPRYGRLNTNAAAVIVGNGYMNTGTERAHLYVIDAETGGKIKEIELPDNQAGPKPNGLSSPTLLDTNGDGKVDYAYAGDLNGNMWKFDLTAASPAAYSYTKLLTASPTASITTAPSVRRHPKGGYMVVFGTGRMLEPADRTTSDPHYVYGVWDGAPAANTAILQQTITELTSSGKTYRYGSLNQPNWSAGADNHKGWRTALPTAGERVVGDHPFINEGRFYFTSSNPNTSATVASGPKGGGWFNQINYITGGGFSDAFLDINEDGYVSSADNVSSQVILGAQLEGRGIYSQPILTDLQTLSLTLFNSNPNIENPPIDPTVKGVAGGHFDVDIYFPDSSAVFKNQQHVHEYDDKYNALGLNMLKAEAPIFNLANAITSTSTQFKVLILNQYLNPASYILAGKGDFVNVKNFQNLASQTTAQGVLDNSPTFTRNDITKLAWKVPVNALETADWWGEPAAVKRAGLIPTNTGCVKDNTHGKPGPNGERHNGALTVQIVKADTPASALELNHSGGDIRFGWRVRQGSDFKHADFKNYVLAEYTYFWHADTKCYHEIGWKPGPNAEGPGLAATGAGTAGSEGFTSRNTVNDSTGKILANAAPTPAGDPTGGGEENAIDNNTAGGAGQVIRGNTEQRLGTGRINWREVVRE